MIPTLLFLSALAMAQGAQICCPDIGCFTDDPPFGHMPLPDCQETQEINMRVYTRATKESGQVITRSTIPPNYNPNQPTLFAVHGWLGGHEYQFLHDVKNAALDKMEYNVIIVGWRGGAGEIWYPKSAANTRVVAAEIALINQNLINIGARKSDMWCVGHSLGGQTCGFAGKRGSFGRITPLDPAGPWFEGSPPAGRVTKDDGDFVDVIHTNAKAGIILPLGMLTPCGDVDYYPNGGGIQPGCIIDPKNNEDVEIDVNGDLTPACSHLRVMLLFVESINPTGCKFEARQQCTDYNNIPGSCTNCNGVCGVMGWEANQSSTRGILYLQTNDRTPFCKS